MNISSLSTTANTRHQPAQWDENFECDEILHGKRTFID